MTRLLFSISFILITFSNWAQIPVMVKDINPGIKDGFFSSSYSPIAISGIIYFTATDSSTGSELWRSDGTESGTYLVKDINPGIDNSAPFDLTNINGTFYFYAKNRLTGSELWRSDGTDKGTYLVKDIASGIASSFTLYSLLTNVNGMLYFQTFTNYSLTNGLWQSDGTEAGTNFVSYPGHQLVEALEMVAVNDRLFFPTADLLVGGGINGGLELYAVDPLTHSIYIVKDIETTGSGSNPHKLTRAGNLLYFIAKDESHSYELWRSDGTTEGTHIVKQLFPDGNTPVDRFGDLTEVGSILFFTFIDINSGTQLWRSDGTEKGTYLVKDISPGTPGSALKHLTNANGNLYFIATTNKGGSALWRSDGTPEGTYLIKDLPNDSYPQNFLIVNNILYFSAYQDSTGYELWQSDGTESGTYLVKDINPGISSSYPSFMINADGRLFFRANDGVHGDELWTLDIGANGSHCRSLQSGNWTSASTWSCGHEPTFDDVVTISAGHAIAISTPSAQALQIINNGGTITFSAMGSKVFIKGKN